MTEIQNTKQPDYKIIGINVGVFLVYTVPTLAFSPKSEEQLSYLFLLVIAMGLHFLFCIVMAIVHKNPMWLVSGCLVLLLGFGSCALAVFVGK